MTTDKTSTAPVSEAFARAVCDGIWVGEEVKKNTPRMLRAINSAIASANAPTPDVVGGDVVAWQCRCRLGGEWSEWQECEKDDFDKRTSLSGWDDGYLETEYRQLCVYAAPSLQGDAVVAEGYDVARHNEWLESNSASDAQPKGEYPECSGDAYSCPENEGYGCCGSKPHPAVQPKGNIVVGSWPWLRGVLSGMPSREEVLGGQRHRYLSRDEVLGWIDEGERRAASAHPAEQTRGDGVEVWMIRRNDGEVHWDETGCVFHDEASASQEARLMTDSDPDGYSFGAFALRSSAPRQAVPDGLDLLRLIRDARHRICNDAAGKANGQAPKDHPVYGPLLSRLDEADAMLAAAREVTNG